MPARQRFSTRKPTVTIPDHFPLLEPFRCGALLAATLRRTSRSCRFAMPATCERFLLLQFEAWADTAVADEDELTSSTDRVDEAFERGTVQSVV